MLKINVHAIDGFNDKQVERIKLALDLVEKAVNSPLFRTKILNYEHKEVASVSGALWWKKYTYKTVPGFYFAKGEQFYSN